jgi:hypothetical protein
MAVNTTISPQNWVPSGFPSTAKAFANLSPKDQDSFQSLPEKQKNSLKEMMQSLAKHDNEAAETANPEEKQAALNADLKTQVEAFVIGNETIKATHNKQEAIQSIMNSVFTNYLRNLNATPQGKTYSQKAEEQQRQKVKENFEVVHQAFEKTAKIAAPNASPEECQAWIDAGDKAVLQDSYQFALKQAFQNPHENKPSAQVSINSHIANTFIFNLLSSPEGRSFLQKASQNNSNPHSKTIESSPTQWVQQ